MIRVELAAGRGGHSLTDIGDIDERAAPAKLPFWSTVGEACQTWFAHFGLRIACPWMVIMLPPVAAIMWITTPEEMSRVVSAIGFAFELAPDIIAGDFGCILCLLPHPVLLVALTEILPPLASRTGHTALLAFSTVAWLFFGTVSIGFLSLSYRFFVRHRMPTAP